MKKWEKKNNLCKLYKLVYPWKFHTGCEVWMLQSQALSWSMFPSVTWHACTRCHVCSAITSNCLCKSAEHHLCMKYTKATGLSLQQTWRHGSAALLEALALFPLKSDSAVFSGVIWVWLHANQEKINLLEASMRDHLGVLSGDLYAWTLDDWLFLASLKASSFLAFVKMFILYCDVLDRTFKGFVLMGSLWVVFFFLLSKEDLLRAFSEVYCIGFP